MTEMKLTVVTATFNVIKAVGREKLIRCVESVRDMPIKHEHLIYDGDSSDGTRELLLELQSTTPGLRVVSERDTGLYDALNKGVRDARGEWLLVLGADDCIFRPTELVRAISVGNSQASDAIASPVQRESGRIFRCRSRLSLCAMPFPHGGLLVKTAQLREVGGFDDQYRIVADFDLVQKLIMRGIRFKVLDECFAFFSDGGLSADLDRITPEHRKIAQKRFGLNDRETIDAYPKRVLPFRVLVKYLFCTNSILRVSAWFHLLLKLANAIGLLADNGRMVLSR